MEKLLTAEEVAELLQIKNIQTIYRWARTGKIPCQYFGRCPRFNESELLEGGRRVDGSSKLIDANTQLKVE